MFTHKNTQPIIAFVRLRFLLLQGKEDLPQMNHPSFKCKRPSSFLILKRKGKKNSCQIRKSTKQKSTHEPEGLRVVVKFAALKDAVDFVEAVCASSSAKGVVQKVGYAPNESFSSTLYSTFLTLILIIGLLF